MEVVESTAVRYFNRGVKEGEIKGAEKIQRKNIKRHLLKSKLSEIEIADILDVDIDLVYTIILGAG